MLAPCDHGAAECVLAHRNLPDDVRTAIDPASPTRHVAFLTTAASPRHLFRRGLDVRVPHDEHHICGPLCGLPGRLSKRGQPMRPLGAARAATLAQLRAQSPWGRDKQQTEAMLSQRRRWLLYFRGAITEPTERYALWRHHRHRPRFRVLVARAGGNASCVRCCDGIPPVSPADVNDTMGLSMAQSDFCAVPPGQDDGDSDRYTWRRPNWQHGPMV